MEGWYPPRFFAGWGFLVATKAGAACEEAFVLSSSSSLVNLRSCRITAAISSSLLPCPPSDASSSSPASATTVDSDEYVTPPELPELLRVTFRPFKCLLRSAW